MDITKIVEVSSKTLATNKSEMEALLSQWLELTLQQSGRKTDYSNALEDALRLLDKSFNLQQFLQKLQAKNH